MADRVPIDDGAKTLLDFLIDLIGRHPSWGYAVVFLVATLECSAFLGLIIPGESVVLFAGFFASRGLFNLGALFLLVVGGTLLNGLHKHAFHRTRPAWEDPILVLTSYSFPSGHAMAATLLYGILAAFIVRAIGDWRWRVLTVLTMGLLIMLIGFSRIYLGVHYLSDVLAAIAAGIAWLSLCLTAVETLRRRRLESCAR